MMNHLPREITEQILSRLPLKSLIRLSCVAKQWRFIVLDPKFAIYHFRIASLQHRLLISKYSEINSLDLETPFSGASCSPLRKHGFGSKLRGRGKLLLLGSCNGLIFVALNTYHGNYYICNPSTGYVNPLPDPGFKSRGIKSFRSGFGYVSATDDYKVFVAARFHGGNERKDLMNYFYDNDDGITEVKIFSSRAKSWRALEGAPSFENLNLNRWRMMPALLHETLHWLQDDNYIVAFDLEKEVFREVLLPAVLSENFILRQVRVFPKDCLSVSLHRGSYIEFWVMREYNVRESWTMQCKYEVATEPDPYLSEIPYPSVAEICVFFTENGIIAQQVQSGVSEVKITEVVEDKCVDMLEGGQCMINRPDDVIEYVESLLSLDGF